MPNPSIIRVTVIDVLPAFFARAVARDPAHIAVDEPGVGARARRRFTYRDIARWSHALAHQLSSVVTGECVVAVLLPRRAEVYVAQLGIMQAGAAYTCIDPSFPDDRAGWMLDDAQAVALVTDADGAARARRAGWTTPIIDIAIPQSAWRDTPPAPSWLGPETLAYLIYTSGTTGRPKGVAIEHRAIANLVAHDLDAFGLTPADRVSQNSSTSYDSSVEELWFAFAAGATVVVVDDEAARLGPDVIPFLRDERITVLCPPPTLLRATGCEDPQLALPELRFVYCGGEPLPRDVADLWSRGRRLANGYGPTECAVTSTHCDIQPGDPISIGWPVRNATAVILDAEGRAVPDSERGELCIGGAGLARGYWRRPELTAEKFIVHPQFGRLYRTGDLAHRDPDGRLFCYGRIDSQVKVRGYRIELDEIDVQLQRCDGVREAASTVQGDGASARLVAFVVPADPSAPLTPKALRDALLKTLPSYMVPSQFATIAALPRTVGGKLTRAQLPMLAVADDAAAVVAPANARAAAIVTAMQHVLKRTHVSAEADFFHELGGDSLAAAMLVTRLRASADTADIAVRDIYDARTANALGARQSSSHHHAPAAPVMATAPRARSLTTTLIQSLWLLLGHIVGSSATYALAFVLLPWLTRQLSLAATVIVLPPIVLVGLVLYAPLAVALAVLIKRLVIGRYTATTAPVWSAFYVRHWIVVAAARLIPWRTLQGTVFHASALRALGATIGERVHIHRGVDLTHGGWDLLTIGDDVVIGQDAVIGVVELDHGCVVTGPVTIGDGAVLDTRAGVGGHTTIGADAHLTALSSLPHGGVMPPGERWDGVPARPAGRTSPPPALTHRRDVRPAVHGVLLMCAEAIVALLRWMPAAALALVACTVYGIEAEHVWDWMETPLTSWFPIVLGMVLLVASVPLTLLVEIAIMRGLGRIPAGTFSLWSLAYIRVWLKTGIVHSAGNWLSGTLFWPMWLRACGMRIGRHCEVSTIIDVVPELTTFGAEVFLADGIYLAGPRLQRGTATLAETSLGDRTFLGNHVVIPVGQHLPDDILIGVSTVSDDTRMRPGSSWFGHPVFELPRREIVDVDRSLTFEPSFIRYWNRVFWEALRVTLPVVPTLVFVLWYRAVVAVAPTMSLAATVFVAAPLITLTALVTLCAVVLASKWLLLGRVKPGQHPLWSCWCSRWDFLYVMWHMYASPALSSLEGTLWLPWYLRAMGMRIGRGVVLGPGFAQVVDPDMLTIDDGATVHAMFQAHTFEDRVLKIDHVRIRAGATLANGTVVLYGADIGERTHVAPHSVVMKQETLLSDKSYEGAPTR